MDKKELWDLYDINRLPRNKAVEREQFTDNDYHVVVHICIFNDKDEMLIQKRAADKKDWPSLWDFTTAGSALHKENSQQCAQRELKEELGIDIDFTNIRPHLTVHFKYGFDDYYLINSESIDKIDINTLNLQKEEVQAVKWAHKESILHMIENNEFVDYHIGLIHALFEMYKKRGAHSKYNA